MVKFKNWPDCNRLECFGCEEGRCIVLIKKDFDEKKCVFFKTREQVAEERAYCENRLADIRELKTEDELC